ncbi:MAG TPA: ABC transporter substrate-binding protein [Egibacteraceae bacterium]|nr:ABC transporter substrate-binding protein [Egibacteraceae bacterium]
MNLAAGRSLRVLLAVLVVGVLAACGGATSDAEPVAATDNTEGDAANPTTLNLGYFPNVTHATALAGDREGIFAEALGDGVELKTHFFNAGGEASEALLSEAIDATFIGPNPAINAFAQTNGEAVRIISGATSGGAFLVVKPGIASRDDLKGKTLSTPQLGNTQDVALRAWLAEGGLATDETGGGDVAILPQGNADILSAFVAGDIDGAWVPEPWATRMIAEGDGEVLVDERDLWPDGKYVTTHVIVRTDYLNEHPEVVKNLLAGIVEATGFVNDNPDEAKQHVIEGIAEITGEDTDPTVLDTAWENLLFTVDPVASSLQESKDDAVAVGLLEEVDLNGIYDLSMLNEILDARGDDPVEGL